MRPIENERSKKNRRGDPSMRGSRLDAINNGVELIPSAAGPSTSWSARISRWDADDSCHPSVYGGPIRIGQKAQRSTRIGRGMGTDDAERDQQRVIRD